MIAGYENDKNLRIGYTVVFYAYVVPFHEKNMCLGGISEIFT